MTRIRQLEALWEESPDDPFLIYALAREHEGAANTMQALLMYEHLVTRFSGYIATYYHYGKLLYSAGNRNEAVKLLHTGIEQAQLQNDMHAVTEMKGLLLSWGYEEEE